MGANLWKKRQIKAVYVHQMYIEYERLSKWQNVNPDVPRSFVSYEEGCDADKRKDFRFE